MTTVHYVVGPPGCGKTTWSARQCRRAVDKYGQDSAMVLSLTNGAASEAAGRDTGLSSKMIGTLHSKCYGAIGMPKLAEDSKGLKAWNEEHPQFSMSFDRDWDWGDAGPMMRVDGDRLLSTMNILRHRMTPRSEWPETLRDFATLWDDYKAQTDSVDFCDMIERALHEVPFAPGRPTVILADEAQDFTALELELLMKWAAHCEHLTLVFDPAQSLYAWRGADERLASVEPSIVLSQSYRVPRAVRERALEIVRNSESYREAEYKPRDEDGSVASVSWKHVDPARWVENLDDPFAGTSMILASCSYMLDPIVAELRRRGIPYHNPFAPTRWNPIRRGTKSRVTAVDRLLGFIGRADRRSPDLATIRALTSSWHASVALKPGWRAAIDAVTEAAGDDADPETLLALERDVFTGDALGAIIATDLEWYEKNLKSDQRKASEYPLAIIERWGPRMLDELTTATRPVRGAVVVGTIHSVKGGEADRVILFPDLSPKGRRMLTRTGWSRRDSLWRMFYVGATRARNELIICNPSRKGMLCPI